jgi:formyltetrahydrofolate synthetase
MAVLLKDAIKPNLVQTLENNPAFMHGGPFANIAHGCNSVIATKAGAEAGRLRGDRSRLRRRPGRREVHRHQVPQVGPAPVGRVLVATMRALKYHGGVDAQAAQHREPGRAGKGPGQPRAPRATTCATTMACPAWCRSTTVRARLRELQAEGYGHYPVCIAKTQMSFSTDPQLRGAPSGHVLNIREVRLAAGAQFVVVVCGDVMTMPGLPREPSAIRIDVDESGRITGLF